MCKALGRSEIFDLQKFFNDSMAGLTNQPYMAYSTHDTPLGRQRGCKLVGCHRIVSQHTGLFFPYLTGESLGQTNTHHLNSLPPPHSCIDLDHPDSPRWTVLHTTKQRPGPTGTASLLYDSENDCLLRKNFTTRVWFSRLTHTLFSPR